MPRRCRESSCSFGRPFRMRQKAVCVGGFSRDKGSPATGRCRGQILRVGKGRRNFADGKIKTAYHTRQLDISASRQTAVLDGSGRISARFGRETRPGKFPEISLSFRESGLFSGLRGGRRDKNLFCFLSSQNLKPPRVSAASERAMAADLDGRALLACRSTLPSIPILRNTNVVLSSLMN